MIQLSLIVILALIFTKTMQTITDTGYIKLHRENFLIDEIFLFNRRREGAKFKRRLVLHYMGHILNRNT